MYKKIYLNWKDITEEITDITVCSIPKPGTDYPYISLTYKNWWVYTLGKNDKLKKEEFWPKFKIWDYVVEKSHYNVQRVDEFIKIYSVRFFDWEFQYNITHLSPKWSYNYLPEHYLRKPTQEELEKYFR